MSCVDCGYTELTASEIAREKAAICDMMSGNLWMGDVIERYANDRRLYNICVRCLCRIVGCDKERRLDALRMLYECKSAMVDEIVLQYFRPANMLRDYELLMSDDVLYNIVKCDDVGRFVEWCAATGCRNGKLYEKSKYYDDDRVVGPMWYALLFGCVNIFKYICSVVDVCKCVGDGEVRSDELWEYAMMSGCVAICDMLVECGVALKCSYYGDWRVCCDDVVWWYLCKQCKNDDPRLLRYGCMVKLVNACNYSVIEKYDLRVGQHYSADVRMNRDIHRSAYAMSVMRERCAFSGTELYTCSHHTIWRALRCRDHNYIMCVKDILRLSDCDIMGDVAEYGDMEMVRKLGVDVHSLPFAVRKRLLLSDCVDLFNIGLRMEDVLGDCRDALKKCMFGMVYNDNAVSILRELGSRAVGVMSAIYKNDVKYGSALDTFNEVCNKVGIVVKRDREIEMMCRRPRKPP